MTKLELATSRCQAGEFRRELSWLLKWRGDIGVTPELLPPTAPWSPASTAGASGTSKRSERKVSGVVVEGRGLGLLLQSSSGCCADTRGGTSYLHGSVLAAVPREPRRERLILSTVPQRWYNTSLLPEIVIPAGPEECYMASFFLFN